MTSFDIYNLLETIAAHPKKTDKEQLLRGSECDELKQVLVAAYNPTLNYYIKKIPDAMVGVSNFTEYTYTLLVELSTRVVTGGTAIAKLQQHLGTLNYESQQLLSRILKRDLRAGFSESTINKVFKDLIIEYPYMQYTLFTKCKPETFNWKRGVYVQTKMDGLYTSINHYPDGEVVGLTRQGREQPATYFYDIFKHFKDYSKAGYQYHGEILVKQNGMVLPREVGNGIANSITKGGELPSDCSLEYVIWDMVPLNTIYEGVSCPKNYALRYAQLLELESSDCVTHVETKIVHSLQEAFAIYADALARGKEGVMLKDASLMWKDHKTTKGAKLKLNVDVDLEIEGFTEGKGKNAELFGAVTCKTCDNLLRVDVSGFTDDMRKYISDNREALRGTIMTVTGNDLMKGNPASLFLPRFSELRTDKTKADTYQQVMEQFENAKAGKL